MGGNYRDHGVPIHEEEEKVQNKNLHNCKIIPTPCKIRLTHLMGWRGMLYTVLQADYLSSKQKWPVEGGFFD